MKLNLRHVSCREVLHFMKTTYRSTLRWFLHDIGHFSIAARPQNTVNFKMEARAEAEGKHSTLNSGECTSNSLICSLTLDYQPLYLC